MIFWIQPFLFSSSNETKCPAFDDKIDLPNFLLTQAAQCLNLFNVANGRPKKTGVRTEFSFRLIRIPHPRQVRKDKNFFHGKRKERMSSMETNVGIVVSSTPLRSRPAPPIVG